MSLNKVLLIEMYLEQKMSIPDISKVTGISKSNVRYHLLRGGAKLRSRSEALDLARPKLGKHLIGKSRVFSAEHKRKLSEAQKSFFEGKAKGVNIHHGYKRLTQGENCNRLQHIVIMEQHLGRKLNKGEVVHHINGDKLDNRIENLMVMTSSEHSRMHAKERQKQGKCYDISKETRRGADNPRAKFSWDQVSYIRSCNKKTREIVAEFGVSRHTINNIKSFKTYKLCQ